MLGLGWPRDTIRVVDADLGVSGSALGQREGFESLVAEVALGQVGIILALEVSRQARDNTAEINAEVRRGPEGIAAD